MTLPVPDLAHFERFCALLTTDQRRPLVLEPFQRDLLGDYFAGVQETLVLIPKKNGKTTILAAVALHHLLYVPDAEVVIAAAASKQAGIMYGFARRFVQRSPGLQKRLLLRPGTYEIRSRRDAGSLKVYAADADTADGVGPTLALVDELHRHKKSDLYDVFSDGLDARDGRMITISTAGSDEDTPLGRMRAKAVAEGRTVRTKDRYRYVRHDAGGFAMHEWALDPAKDDLHDLKTVKLVNPLSSMTLAKLKRRRDSPSMTSTRWARLACNVWAQEEDAAISALDWAPCGEDGADLPDGTKDVVVSIDLGWTRDTTAIVPIGVRDDEAEWFDRDAFIDPDDEDNDWLTLLPESVGRATIATPRIVTPPGDGRMIREEVIKDALRGYAERWPSARYVIDPNADGQTIAQWIERELCGGDADRVVSFAQQPAPMAGASMLVAAHVRLAALRHPNDALGLSAQVLAAWGRPVGARWRFDKHPKLKKPIDAAVALAMGLRTLRAPAPVAPRPFAVSLRR